LYLFYTEFLFSKALSPIIFCSVKFYVRIYIWRIFKLVMFVYHQCFVVSYIKAWNSRRSLCLRLSWLNCSPNIFAFSTMLCTFNKQYFCNNISLQPSRIVTWRIFIASSNRCPAQVFWNGAPINTSVFCEPSDDSCIKNIAIANYGLLHWSKWHRK